MGVIGQSAVTLPSRKTRNRPRQQQENLRLASAPNARCSAVQINEMAISVAIGGPKIEGLERMSPAVPEFDAAVHSLFKGNSGELLKLKPFLTILSNRSNRTLVAYAVRWEIALGAGRHTTTSQYKYPDAVAPAVPRRGNEIRRGEQKIVAMSIEIQACLSTKLSRPSKPSSKPMPQIQDRIRETFAERGKESPHRKYEYGGLNMATTTRWRFTVAHSEPNPS
jgi:hypothetical protein